MIASPNLHLHYTSLFKLQGVAIPVKGEDMRQNPRTSRVRQVILDAAVDLLLTRGAGEVTATRVAEATGVARTTVYRQWPDQASLLLATIDTLVAPHFSRPGSGELRTDVRNALLDLRTRLTTRQVRPVLAALVDYATRDEAFVAAQRRFVAGLTQPTVDVLTAAQAIGQLPDTLDCSNAAAMLTGPLFYQHLLMHDVIGDELIDEVTSQFVGG